MTQKIRKLLCLILTSVIVLSISTTSLAVETEKDARKPAYTVSCAEYPNAYITIEKSDEASNGLRKGLDSSDAEKSLGTVSATVFVEESYQLIDGEVIVTNSRLLSKEEVDAIGVENFESLETQKPGTSMFSSITPNAAINTRGKLTIICSGVYSISGNSVTCDLTGNAQWSGFDFFYSPTNNPAAGSDFIGYAWAGGFQCDADANASWYNGGSQDIYLCESSPNAARVWEFEEVLDLGDAIFYVDNVMAYATLSKANMDGGGNKAEAVLKYIHTYQVVTGTISINASSGGVGTGFSLTNTPKQWSLVVTISDIPY